MSHEKPFERENRYIVLKKSDIEDAERLCWITAGDAGFLNSISGKLAFHRWGESKPARGYLVIEKDWPEYELAWALLEARCRVESGEAGELLRARYFSALGDIHKLAEVARETWRPKAPVNGPTDDEEPAKREIVQHWYLVCWQAANGIFGSTELWLDRPWMKGYMNLAIQSIGNMNPGARMVALTSVTPIDPPQQKQ